MKTRSNYLLKATIVFAIVLFVSTFELIIGQVPRSAVQAMPVISQSREIAQAQRVQPFEFIELNFKSVKTGAVSTKILKLRNDGASSLVIRIGFDNPAFSSSFGHVEIAPNAEVLLPVSFAPLKGGIEKGFLSLWTARKNNSPVKVKLVGEGIYTSPITIWPNSIKATIDKDENMQQVLTITNNGSFLRTYNIDVIDVAFKYPSAAAGANGRIATPYEASSTRGSDLISGLRKKPLPHRSLTISELKFSNLPSHLPDSPFYMTNFEEFSTGNLERQEGWVASEGWQISAANPDHGVRHLRGISGTSGEEFTATSPIVHDSDWMMHGPDTTFFTTFSARINVDRAQGSTWDITLRDYYGIGVTNVRVSPDKTVFASGLTGLGYKGESVPVSVPSSGYFDLAVEHGPQTGGPAFNTISVYVNGERVYKGYSMGGLINEVTFRCGSDQPGSILDVDGVMLRRGDFVPRYITPASSSGIIRPGETKKIPLSFNVSGMKFGTFSSTIVTTIDSVEQFAVPSSIRVVGEPLLSVRPDSYYFVGWEFSWMDFLLRNMGGTKIGYTIEELPDHAFDALSDTILPESANSHYIGWGPKLIVDSLVIRTDIPDHPIHYVPITSIVLEPYTEFYLSRSRIDLEVTEGESVTDTISLANLATGFDDVDEWENPIWVPPGELLYKVVAPRDEPVSANPVSGILYGEAPATPITLTLDATGLPLGEDSVVVTIYNNNNVRPVYPLTITYRVIAKDASHESNVSRGVKSFSLYPNPVRDRTVRLTLPEIVDDGAGVSCRISSATGITVYAGMIRPSADSTYTLQLPSDLPSGVYVVAVVQGRRTFSRRLMVY